MNREHYLSAGFILGCSLALSACGGGHGTYTQEAIDQQQEHYRKLRGAADYDLAYQQYTSGNLDLALESVDRAIKNYDKVPSAHILRARTLLERGDAIGALASLDAASRLDPEDPEIDYYKGVVYERINELDSALAHYQAALSRNPASAKYGLVTAELLIDLHRFAEARELLESGRGDASSQAGFKQALGHIDLMEHKLDDAHKHFEEAVALEPEDGSLLEDLARVNARLGNYADAEAELSRVLSTPPNEKRRDLMLLRASCLIELRRPVEARTLLLALTKESGQTEDIETLLRLVDVGAMLDDENTLSFASSRLISRAPERPEGYIALALNQRRKGNLKGALETTNLALSKKPDDPSAATLKKLLEKQLAP